MTIKTSSLSANNDINASNTVIINSATLTQPNAYFASITPAAFTSNATSGVVNSKTVGQGDTLNVYNTGVASNTNITNGGGC